ncbi:MAG: ABC transporter ATP-binding protein [Zavarzinella sp.]
MAKSSKTNKVPAARFHRLHFSQLNALAPQRHSSGQAFFDLLLNYPHVVLLVGSAMQFEVKGLTKSFPSGESRLEILADVDLQMTSGESLSIVGPSGCGKSTLLHIFGTLDQPDGGEVLFDGTNPFQLDEPKLAQFRNKNIGFVFQDHLLLPQCNVLENVLVPTLVARDGNRKDFQERATNLLERVGLAHRMTHSPAKISGGERQRVAIARALIHRPSMLLADEPTGNLDQASAGAITDLLFQLHEQEQSIFICVTHSGEFARTFRRQVEMRDKKLVSLLN